MERALGVTLVLKVERKESGMVLAQHLLDRVEGPAGHLLKQDQVRRRRQRQQLPALPLRRVAMREGMAKIPVRDLELHDQ